MAIFELTEAQKKNINIIIPFGIGGMVFYSSYVKAGKTDWKNAGIMTLIVFICAIIVTTQVTNMFDDYWDDGKLKSKYNKDGTLKETDTTKTP